MDLVLWRHAEAHELVEGDDDLQRVLTVRGEKQAARMAAWLDRHLPDSARVLVSPAQRAEQTAVALGRKYKIRPEIAPQSDADQLLTLVDWPNARGTTLVVGHQPVLGQVIARLLQMQLSDCAVRKGAIWWLRHRERHGTGQTVLLTVQSPDTL